MIARTIAEPDVVLLRDRVFLGDDALSSLLVELDTAAEVFLRSEAQRLTLVQSEIRVYVHLERAA